MCTKSAFWIGNENNYFCIVLIKCIILIITMTFGKNEMWIWIKTFCGRVKFQNIFFSLSLRGKQLHYILLITQEPLPTTGTATGTETLWNRYFSLFFTTNSHFILERAVPELVSNEFKKFQSRVGRQWNIIHVKYYLNSNNLFGNCFTTRWWAHLGDVDLSSNNRLLFVRKTSIEQRVECK